MMFCDQTNIIIVMRINQFVASASDLSRRASDKAVEQGRVMVNGKTATTGQQVAPTDIIKLDGTVLASRPALTVMLNKPVGYICSRNGQGGKTIYDLLPAEYQYLKPIGRLDKDSSGLLLLTSDGNLAQKLTHPSFQKQKVYQVELDKPLAALHQQMINDIGLNLEDGRSQLTLEKLEDSAKSWRVTMSEGRNRQIRRTFAALNYTVIKLHRTNFGKYTLDDLANGKFCLATGQID